MAAVQESVRQHDDRLSYLESRHKGLHDQVNLKMASDSEFKDWTINRNEEDWFTVMGLPRLGKMTPREWQAAARRQVSDLIKVVLNANKIRLEYTVLYVGNPVRRRTTGMTVYNVRVNSVAVATRIRDLYSGFFRKDHPVSLPPHLRGVSLRNKVTLATRIRLRILRELGNIYVASNPGASFNVRGYDPRPILTTFPARGSTDRPQTYNFVEAATSLSASFSDEALASIFQVVGTHHEGELRSLFVVISDDERERCLELAKTLSRSDRRSGVSVTAPITASGSVIGSGTGMGLEARFLESLRAAPPPPPHDSPVSERPHRRPDDLVDPTDKRDVSRDDHDHVRKRAKRSRRSSSQSSESSDDRSRKKRAKGSKRSPSRSSESSGSHGHRKKKSRRRSSRRSRSPSSSSGPGSTPAPPSKSTKSKRH